MDHNLNLEMKLPKVPEIELVAHTGENEPDVKVQFEMTKEKLMILVTDSGKGFNPDDVEEPDIKKKIEDKNKRGWGLKLMKSMSDDLIIESKPTGTKISIIKNLS